jgi:hypothetical protein
MSDQQLNRALLSEDVANRLLARAVALDAAHGSELTVDQLREAAREAGISEQAFDQAVHEWNAVGRVTVTSRPASARGRLRHWADEQWAEVLRALMGNPVRNVLALAAFWGVLTVLVSYDRANAVSWLVRKATDPIALGIGALIASRLRARPVALLLTGLAVAQGAEFVMDAVLGTPAVQGFGSHLALMITGVVGVLLGRIGTRLTATGVTDPDWKAMPPRADGSPGRPLERPRLRLGGGALVAARATTHHTASV